MTTDNHSSEAKEGAAKNEVGAKDPAGRRVRSPAYPAIGLEDALAKASQIWQKLNRHDGTPEEIVNLMGGSNESSASHSASSALIKYGLLSDSGSGPSRRLKLTDAAIKLVFNPDKESHEYKTLIRDAAIKPAIHAELWNKYSGTLPTSSVISRYLVTERGFNPKYVNGFIEMFKETISFAKLEPGGIVSQNDASKTNGDANADAVSSIEPEPKSALTPYNPVNPPSQSTSPFVNDAPIDLHEVTAKSFRYMLSKGVLAEVHLVGKTILPAHIDMLCSYLGLQKKALEMDESDTSQGS